MTRSTKQTNDRIQTRLLLGLAQGMPLKEAALRAGVSVDEARKKVRALRYLIASNDSNIDDYLREAEAIELFDQYSVVGTSTRAGETSN